jgi:hypothetical protein
LSALQEEALKAFVATTLPRSTREVGAFIAQEFGRPKRITLRASRGVEANGNEVTHVDPDSD